MDRELYHTHISAEHKMLELKLKEVWRYRDLIMLFTKRSFKVSYKQTILGPLWLFINPLLTSIVYVVLFGHIAKLGTEGVPQLLFYLAGNAIWGFYNTSLTNNSSTFVGNAGLFGKVYFPRLTVPISNILSGVIRFFIQMILVAALLVFYIILGQVHIHPACLPLILVVLLWLGIMGMGLGIIVSSLTTKYRDLSVLVTFGMQIWMYATPVVYPLSTVTNPFLHKLLLINPVTMPVELFRYALLGVGTFDYRSIIGSIVFTVVVAFLGIIIFNRVERTFMDTV